MTLQFGQWFSTLRRKVVPSRRRESSSNDRTPCYRRHDVPETLVWEHKITNRNLIHTHKYQVFTICFHIYYDIPNNVFPKCCIDRFVLSFQESTLWDKEIKWHVWKCRPASEKLTNTDGGFCFYPRPCTCYNLITSCTNIWSLRQCESILLSNLLPHPKNISVFEFSRLVWLSFC